MRPAVGATPEVHDAEPGADRLFKVVAKPWPKPAQTTICERSACTCDASRSIHTKAKKLTARGRDSPTETSAVVTSDARAKEHGVCAHMWSGVRRFMRSMFKRRASPSY